MSQRVAEQTGLNAAGGSGPVIELVGVSKTYRHKHAVREMSFQIGRGEAVAILGANGAGKTTTLSLLLGLLEPSAGQVRMFGMAPKDPRVKRRTGVLLQEVSVMDGLKAKELIRLISSYYEHPLPLDQLLELTGLDSAGLEQQAGKLSGGQKRRLGVALALAGDPELVILDEPTVGLDVASRRAFWERIKMLKAAGKTVLFTTHDMQEAEDAADRIILLAHGSVIAEGTPGGIKERLARRSVSFWMGEGLKVEQLTELFAEAGPGEPAVSVSESDGRVSIYAADTDRVLAALFRHELPVSGIMVDQGRLDDALLQLAAQTDEDGEGQS